MKIQNSLDTTEETESNFIEAEARQSHMAKIRNSWAKFTIASLSRGSGEHRLPDPFRVGEEYAQVGVVVPTVDAVRKGALFGPNCDIRPRLFDKSTNQFRLIDTGSMITATAKKPGDKVDNTFRLVAVNGSQITTYGVREIIVKIGRKTYKMEAVICDIEQDILGMDFIDHYKLGFDWDDFDQSELFIFDKRAQIKVRLEHVSIPHKSLPRVGAVRVVTESATGAAAEILHFGKQCVSALKTEEPEKVVHKQEYLDLINKYKAILTPNFNEVKTELF